VVNRRAAGYTLLEVIIAMALFGVFILILTMLTAEMRKYEQRLPVNFMRHPQITAVLSRMRQDVLDADIAGMYPDTAGADDEYEQGEKVLIVRVWRMTGAQTVVWDFRKPGEVRRISYNVGQESTWVARGVPPEFSSAIKIDALDLGRAYATHITATDRNGKLAIDQIYQPRAHH
jgi:prepilin-type N-terminal cleavage/methylation domain-containing protein